MPETTTSPQVREISISAGFPEVENVTMESTSDADHRRRLELENAQQQRWMERVRIVFGLIVALIILLSSMAYIHWGTDEGTKKLAIAAFSSIFGGIVGYVLKK